MRDKPSFDDLEPPPIVTTPIDGMSDEQWAARLERRERRWRMAFGSVFGAAVGALAVFPSWPWMISRSSPALSFVLVISGCSILFGKLFSQRRDEAAIEHAQWILLPQWYLVQKLPVWVLALLISVGLAVVIVFLAALAIGTMAPSR